MRYIPDNNTLMAYIPNVVTAVEGEKDLFTKMQSHLEIAEAGYIHHTGDGHEGNTRQAGPDHGDGHFPPGRRTGCVKIFVVLCHF